MKKLHSSYLYTKIAFKNQVRQRKKEMKKKIKFNLSKVYGILFSTFTAHRTLPSTPTFSNRLTWSKWEILANFFLSHFLPYNGHHCFDFRSKKKVTWNIIALVWTQWWQQAKTTETVKWIDSYFAMELLSPENQVWNKQTHWIYIVM